MYLNLNADSEDVDNWEVNMKLKQSYEHLKNWCLEWCKCLLKEQQQTLQEEVIAIKQHEAETAAIQLEELTTMIWLTIQDHKMSEWSQKGYEIKIHLLTDYMTFTEGYWMHTEEYMSSKFLNKVKALENLIQHKYDQYEMYQHLKWIIRKRFDNYAKLITTDKELTWFKELWRKFTESQDKFWSTGQA